MPRQGTYVTWYSTKDSNPLVSKYVPMENPNPRRDDFTVISAHASGFLNYRRYT